MTFTFLGCLGCTPKSVDLEYPKVGGILDPVQGEEGGMSDQQLVNTYVLDASEAEHSRLIGLAQQSAGNVRELCARAGLREGHVSLTSDAASSVRW